MSPEATNPPSAVNVPGDYFLFGRFSGDHIWPVLGVSRGHHNPDLGYNSFEGLVEEDCVQALEQIISEKFKVEKPARIRWKESDDGIHVFAVALYHLMKEENYNGESETFRQFLIRMIRSGKLAAGRIKPIYDAFYSH
jgi:hypothetical protein